MSDLVHCALGLQPYKETWDLQKRLQQALIHAKRSEPAVELPHLALQVEHPPVYTLGKSGDDQHLLLDNTSLESIGATFERIDRGGDITFHGPGQLVLYPILDLDLLFNDLVRYLRTLEEAVIKTLDLYGIKGQRVSGRTGVWVGTGATSPMRKICAMGIRCSRWVTIHGLALNIATDLSYFDNIIPCGIKDAPVTSMEKELGFAVSADKIGGEVVRFLAQEFGISFESKSGQDAEEFLKSIADTVSQVG